MKKNRIAILYDILGIVFTGIIFLIPLYILIIPPFKNVKEGSIPTLNLPTSYHIIENYMEVLKTQNGLILTAFKNSFIITIFSVVGIILVSSMAAYVMQRRTNRFSRFWDFIILTGLMVPPSVVTTIWLFQFLHIFKTKFSMVLIMIALMIPFAVIVYKGFMKTIPREIDEAAIIDGCGGLRLFFQIIFPLLRPVNITVIIVTAIAVYSDFVNALNFLPGLENRTVQLTLFNFMGMYSNKWNLLFADVVLITLPPIIFFIFLNRKIISGMVAGSIKG